MRKYCSLSILWYNAKKMSGDKGVKEIISKTKKSTYA